MLTVDIICPPHARNLPDEADFISWADAAYLEKNNAELALSIVDSEQITQLNKQFRGKNKATNVLSFPSDTKLTENVVHLGDIVLCETVIKEEAVLQNKSSKAHWAHMVVHGMLHLQNYDHETNQEAETMEALEIEILSRLGFDNPYLIS